MNWRIVWAIALKDIVDAVKNLYILFGLLMPIGISLLLGVMLPGKSPAALTIVVHDPGGSRLVAALRAAPDVHMLDVASADLLPAEVEKRATGGLAVPANLDAAVDAGQQPELTVYVNQRRTGVEQAVFQRVIEQQLWAMVDQPVPARVVLTRVGTLPGQATDSEFRYDQWLLVMLMVVGVAMAGVFVVPTLLVEEKEKRTLDALLVSPVRPVEVVAGKAVAGMVYAVLMCVILLAMNRGWVGNWPLTIVAVLLGSLFAVAVGLLMGGLSKTTGQVNTWSSIVMIGLMVPTWGGVFGPPNVVETLFRLVPTYYFADAMRRSLNGSGWSGAVWLDLGVLAGGTALVLAGVVWALRRETR